MLAIGQRPYLFDGSWWQLLVFLFAFLGCLALFVVILWPGKLRRPPRMRHRLYTFKDTSNGPLATCAECHVPMPGNHAVGCSIGGFSRESL